MEEVKLNITTDNNEVVIRTGTAELIVPKREKISIYGNLDTALNYLKHPPKWFAETLDINSDSVLNYSCLKVDRDNLSIDLVVDEGSSLECHYYGSLSFDELFVKFGINSDKSFTTFELADLAKMYRSYFAAKDLAMKLVSDLRNFKAKVDKQVESADDLRGNKTMLYRQAVDSNIPEDFKIAIPVFKGYEAKLLTVEIAIDASDFSCRLISPDAMDYVNELKNELIDAQLVEIKELFPSLKIFEV